MAITIRDMQGNVVGYQDRDGTLRTAAKKKIGALNTRNGAVRDQHNLEVGFIDSDGNVVDRYRRRVGRIGKDGVVEDWHGIALYTGSAAPLLLDFVQTESDSAPEHFDFDAAARQAAGSGNTEFERRLRPAQSARERLKNAVMQEGFVSPSALGCLGLIGAFVIGLLILFIVQNPAMLSRPAVAPTSNVSLTPLESNNDNAPAANNAPQATATPQPATGKVNVELLNLRAGPGTTFERVDGLKQDTIVILVGRTKDNTWYQVKAPLLGKDGWVAAQYIDTTADIKELPIVETPAP
ncbi:MAG: hypothetical protein HDKAJFGB_03908 [Anaerolineae bacterium]|nr:hypothetical protein [Anaerolineae bacterium]